MNTHLHHAHARSGGGTRPKRLPRHSGRVGVGLRDRLAVSDVGRRPNDEPATMPLTRRFRGEPLPGRPAGHPSRRRGWNQRLRAISGPYRAAHGREASPWSGLGSASVVEGPGSIGQVNDAHPAIGAGQLAGRVGFVGGTSRSVERVVWSGVRKISWVGLRVTGRAGRVHRVGWSGRVGSGIDTLRLIRRAARGSGLVVESFHGAGGVIGVDRGDGVADQAGGSRNCPSLPIRARCPQTHSFYVYTPGRAQPFSSRRLRSGRSSRSRRGRPGPEGRADFGEGSNAIFSLLPVGYPITPPGPSELPNSLAKQGDSPEEPRSCSCGLNPGNSTPPERISDGVVSRCPLTLFLTGDQ